jgi:hypothetical protein
VLQRLSHAEGVSRLFAQQTDTEVSTELRKRVWHTGKNKVMYSENITNVFVVNI